MKCNLQGTLVNLPFKGHLKDILEQEGPGCVFVCSPLCVCWCVTVIMCVFIRYMTECVYYVPIEHTYGRKHV